MRTHAPGCIVAPGRHGPFLTPHAPSRALDAMRHGHRCTSSRLGASPVESETHKVGARQPAFACISLHKLRRCPPRMPAGGIRFL
eukprot:scaffold12489_cov145-Isochrysis_galbana.AAC.1